MAAYCRLSRPRHVAGLVQHGWTVVSPLGVHFGDFPGVGRTGRRNLLVWSHASRGWRPEEVDRPTIATGSPWAYLDAVTAGASVDVPDGSPDVVCLPFHGTRLMRVRGDHRRLAREVAEREGSVTVCLHHEDLEDVELVAAWRSAGHQVATAGTRSDPFFLFRVMGAMRSARRVVSNRLTTSVMYAAALGTDVAVYGNPMVLAASSASNDVQRVVDLWPEMHGERLDIEATTRVARTELGYHHVLDPNELARALRWDRRWSAGPALDYWINSSVGKALRVLGMAERAGTHAEIPVAGFSPLTWLRHPLDHLPSPLPRALPPTDRLPWLLTPRRV